MYVNYWKQLTDIQKEDLAMQLKTSTEYLRLILTGHKKPGPALALKLHEKTNGLLDKAALRPDIFHPRHDSTSD